MDPQLYALQVRLHGLGFYTGTLDGLYGPATERAIDAVTAAYERAAGIKPLKWPRLLPAHAYLRNITGLPLIVVAGLDIFGTIEVAGTGSSKLILGWRDELNIPARDYPNDGVPWCGLGVGICAKRAGKDITPVGNVLWARNWSKFGVPVDKDKPMLGDVMVWARGTGGHVNIYVGEHVANGARYFHGLGSNQNDQVNIMAKRADSGLLAVRRPVYRVQPVSVRAYQAGSGAPLGGTEH